MRLAMWSGPRNISTAMMRAWENRSDCFVSDEPLYAFYLKETGLPHPGAATVMANGETDWQRLAEYLTGPIPEGKAVWFQKHMAHHLPPERDMDWLHGMRHAFLIRHPAEMLRSLHAVIPNPRLEDTGLPQQVELLRRLPNSPILDSRDVLENPAGMLSALCRAVGVSFEDSMLSWAPGPRATDGVWAKYWYANVERSTGFGPPPPEVRTVSPELEGTLADCMPLYQALRTLRLKS